MFLQVQGVLLLGDLEIGAVCHVANLLTPVLIVVGNGTRGEPQVFVLRFRSTDWRGHLSKWFQRHQSERNRTCDGGSCLRPFESGRIMQRTEGS